LRDGESALPVSPIPERARSSVRQAKSWWPMAYGWWPRATRSRQTRSRHWENCLLAVSGHELLQW